MEQNKRKQFIIRRVGGTTYKVKVVFNESGYETMEDKILRIVRNDIVVLKRGEIIAAGTQDQLLKTCPLYQDMWQAHIGAKNWAVSTAEKEA